MPRCLRIPQAGQLEYLTALGQIVSGVGGMCQCRPHLCKPLPEGACQLDGPVLGEECSYIDICK